MIALISDIHGNYEALKQVLAQIDKMNIREIFCLGDVVGYYSQVNECCDILRTREVPCVMGNHDWYMATGSGCPRSHSVNDCLVYQRKVITKENKNWISQFPVLIRAYGLSMVHGGWQNPIDEYLEPAAEYFSELEGEYFASGHNHVQLRLSFGNKHYCNPGSVGQPRDGDPRASFATFDGQAFQLHRVEYDIQRVGALMAQSGFSPYYYGCLNDASKNLHS